MKKVSDFNREIEILKKKGFEEIKGWPDKPCWRFVKYPFTISLWFSGEVTSWKYIGE
jgi:hypothetical protein